MCEEHELKAILKRVDEHLTKKEKMTSDVLGGLTIQLKTIEGKLENCMRNQNKIDEMLMAWKDAKGLARITRYIFYFVLAIGALLTALKTFPISFK